MRRVFELHGRRVECETRQVDANCWELRVTEADGTVRIQYFSDPRAMDQEATSTQRGWVTDGWQPPPFQNWIPSTDLAK